MKIIYSMLAAVVLTLIASGCAVTNPNAPMTHAAFSAAVTLGERFILEAHPEAVPHVRIATAVICSAATGSNVQPAQIVAALTEAGITNAHAKDVINVGIALYNVVFASYGADWVNNQPTLKLYMQDLCNGLTAGLPPESQALARKQLPLPPHLR